MEFEQNEEGGEEEGKWAEGRNRPLGSDGSTQSERVHDLVETSVLIISEKLITRGLEFPGPNLRGGSAKNPVSCDALRPQGWC